MSGFSAANYLSNAGRTEAEMKTAFEDNLQATKQIPGAGEPRTVLTIASGSVTPTIGVHGIDTEGAASTDDLTNIVQTNLPDGSGLIIKPSAAGHSIVVKHAAGGAGQISLTGSADFTMTDIRTHLYLQRVGTQWNEIGRFYSNLDAAALRTFYALAGLAQNSFTGRQEWKQGANLTSSSTLTLGTDGNYFFVTGTTTITGISTAPAGTVIRLQFQSSGCLITHNATSLIMHYGSHLSRAGDVLEFVSEGSGNWREVAPVGQPRVLDHVTANTTVVSSVTETSVYSTTVQPNVLGTARKLRLTLLFNYTYSGATAISTGVFQTRGTVVRLKYGATTVASAFLSGLLEDDVGTFVAGFSGGIVASALLCGDGATNSQLGYLGKAGGIGGLTVHYINPPAVHAVTILGEFNPSLSTGRGTAAEDSTAAKTLTVTVEHQTLSASNSITMESAVLEVLP